MMNRLAVRFTPTAFDAAVTLVVAGALAMQQNGPGHTDH